MWGVFNQWLNLKIEENNKTDDGLKLKTGNRNIAQMIAIWESEYPTRILGKADVKALGQILGEINRILTIENEQKGLLGQPIHDYQKIEIWADFVPNMPLFLKNNESYDMKYIADRFPSLYRDAKKTRVTTQATSDIESHLDYWKQTTFLIASEYDIEQLKKKLKTGHTLEDTKLLIEYIRNAGYDSRFYRMENAFGTKYQQFISEAKKWKKYGKPDQQTFWYIKNGKEHLLNDFKGQKTYA